MSKYRQAAKVDSNQKQIVKELRQIPGVSVQPGMDDLLVGYTVNGIGHNLWLEIKTPEQLKKDGTLKAGALKPSQVELMESWCGNYHVVTCIEDILKLMLAIHE